jgi:hypothetical protein
MENKKSLVGGDDFPRKGLMTFEKEVLLTDVTQLQAVCDKYRRPLGQAVDIKERQLREQAERKKSGDLGLPS